ncbi:glycosyl hydrolase [Truncatella angustata]|uniref:Glycosyl hydrolase n=1 Tax=Truncatella angustata TaxID=152316 RepID=A0A9P9A1I8_9PEZI|nr:glycosyl hydrolase [Truncatella angustata]KAH6657201.1 glycosyl hydrolase [Truncatella angustata]
MDSNRFRPISHFIAPHSWSNDPCGACYIPETDDYIVCYQWNPGTSECGNCAWGMARSKDLVTWVDCMPALENGDTYDSKGVFSGSIVSRVIAGKTTLFLFYTSISALPIHWSKPYVPGCESQSLAYSTDFGKSWKRRQNNPLLSTPPRGARTTGWRDPFVSKWSSLTTLLGVDRDTNYMLIASGEKEHGPQLHIYESHELCDGWEYLATILDVKSGTTISDNSHHFFGMNFECASFFTLDSQDYILLGVEENESSIRHRCRYTLWLSGSLILDDGKPQFIINSHGVIDHGISYAPHIFRDKSNRVLQLGWADECANQHIVKDQGWAGCLTYPREMFKCVKSLDLEVARKCSEWTIDQDNQTMSSLGIRLAQQIDLIRGDEASMSLQQFQNLQSTTYEISAKFSKLSGSEKFIINVRQSLDYAEITQLVFDIAKGLIIVDRSRSSSTSLGSIVPDSGLFQLLSGEELNVRILVDVSIIEIYVNDRFALTSRVYPSLETSIHASYDFGTYREENLSFECWDNLKEAWPVRGTRGHSLEAPLATSAIQE